MIRRDYLLRMTDRCIQALARALGFTEDRQFDLARGELDLALRELGGLDLARALSLSESELMAALMRGEPTQVLSQKCLLLTALLHRAGQTYAAQSRLAESRAACLKALSLQLHVLLQNETAEFPGCVPKLDALVSEFEGGDLPVPTSAALMQHYERIGAFAKAEDMLFAMAETEPGRSGLAQFGVQFYERMLRKRDEALELGNLPRAEVEAGLAEWRSRWR